MGYDERLKNLRLTTLRFRRLRGDLIEMYKHFNTHDKEALTGPSFKPRERPSRQHKHQVILPAAERRHGLRENAFYGRISNAWNGLPRDVVEAENVNCFKNALDNHLKDHPMKYNHRYADELERRSDPRIWANLRNSYSSGYPGYIREMNNTKRRMTTKKHGRIIMQITENIRAVQRGPRPADLYS